MTGSPLTNHAMRACLRERDIGVRDIGQRDIGEWEIGETVTTCRFAEQLLIHIHI